MVGAYGGPADVGEGHWLRAGVDDLGNLHEVNTHKALDSKNGWEMLRRVV